ncbi:MAG: OmpA family protein [Bacteroidota bacterium]
MKRNLFIIVFLIISINRLFSQEVSLSFILFDQDKYELTELSRKKLDSIVMSLSNIPEGFDIYIAGHTDSIGSFDYNMQLSKKRTEVVHDYFVSKSFLKKHIKVDYFGYTKAIKSDNTENGKQLNRRVEVSICTREIDVPKSLGIKKEHKSYKFNSSKNKVIYYEETGTIIYIPDSAFQTVNGESYNGKVIISYNEYRNRAEYLLSDVPMQVYTKDSIFPMVSGGMFRIKATDENGNDLVIKSKKRIEVKFNLTNELSDMFFWYRDTVKSSWIKLKEIAKIKSPNNRFLQNTIYSVTDYPTRACWMDSCAGLNFIYKNASKWLNNGYISYLTDQGKKQDFEKEIKQNTDKIIQLKKKDFSLIKFNERTNTFELLFINDKKQNDLVSKIEFMPEPLLSNSDLKLLTSKTWPVFDIADIDKLFQLQFSDKDTSIILKVRCLYKGKKDNPKTNKKLLDALSTWAKYINKNQTQADVQFVAIEKINKNYVNSQNWNSFQDSLDCFWAYSKLLMTTEKEKSLSRDKWLKFFQSKPYTMLNRYSSIKSIADSACVRTEPNELSVILERKITTKEFLMNMDSLRRIASKVKLLKEQITCYSNLVIPYINDSLKLDSLKQRCIRLTNIQQALSCYNFKYDLEYMELHFDSLAIVCRDWERMLAYIPCNLKGMDDYIYLKAHYDSLRLECQAQKAKEAKIKQQQLEMQTQVNRFFEIDKLGVYNCDQIARLINPKSITADYADEKGKSIKITGYPLSSS